MSDAFEDSPTVVAEVPRKSIAQWAADKGHMYIRKGMRRGDPGVRKPDPSAFGAACLVSSRSVQRPDHFRSNGEYLSALVSQPVTEAEYDAAREAFQKIVIR